MAIVYSPDGKILNPVQLAAWANKVHRIAGGKGNVFTSEDYHSDNPSYRLRGDMCDCGCKQISESLSISNGEFRLFPLDDEGVISGGKAYMMCRKCGCISHL